MAAFSPTFHHLHRRLLLPLPRRPHLRPHSSYPPHWLLDWSHPHPHIRPNRLASFPRRPAAAVDYRPFPSSSEDDEDAFGTSRTSGSSTMGRIVTKLKQFGYIDDATNPHPNPKPLPEKGSVEDIFYAEDGDLPNSRGGLSSSLYGGDDGEVVRFPWERPTEKERGMSTRERERKRRTSLAELTLPDGELRRLRHMAIRMKSRTKVRGAGVTKEVVDKIHEKWKTDEVVRIKVEGPPALNMKRVHEILEVSDG